MVGEVISHYRILAESGGDYVDGGAREPTTHSLEAFRHNLAGVDYLIASSFDRAIGELQQAVAIDPDFTLAYYQLGLA